MKIDPILNEIASIFTLNKKEIYLVGGAVRDMLMGKPIHDWDLATSALPEEVAIIMRRAGGKVIPTGIKHGTVTVLYRNKSCEVTTFRTESDYSDGRRPDKIEYAATIEEDLSRRDFTMNAIALRLPDKKIVDPYNGKRDIKAGIIRCVGSPCERFSEDGLRPLRAVRFASQLSRKDGQGFEIEKETLDAIPKALSVSAKISWERVRDEIDKILLSRLPSHGFLLMEKTGLLKLFLEELAACRGIEQKGFHEFDVLDHSLHACDYAAANNYSHELRLAALFHDIGKPLVAVIKTPEPKVPANQSSCDPRGCQNAPISIGVWTFYRHEEKSCKMAHDLMRRLKYPNAVTEKTCHLIKEHMFMYTPDWSDSAVRRFIARVGEENLDDVYKLRRADVYAFSCREPDLNTLLPLVERTDKILKQGRAFTIKDLAVNGKDLMEIGIPAGKTLGIILKQLLETVLDDPEQNTKEKLLAIANSLALRR